MLSGILINLNSVTSKFVCISLFCLHRQTHNFYDTHYVDAIEYIHTTSLKKVKRFWQIKKIFINDETSTLKRAIKAYLEAIVSTNKNILLT